jgi:acetylornithine aminotransferase
MEKLRTFDVLENVRGKGLMIGFDVPEALQNLRKELLFNHHIFTGASGTRTVRLLPSLALTLEQADYFLEVLEEELQQNKVGTKAGS